MIPLSPVAQDHVIRLNQEMLDLERDKRRLMKGLRLANDDCRQHKVYYAYLLKKQELFLKHNRAQREELYSMALSARTHLKPHLGFPHKLPPADICCFHRCSNVWRCHPRWKD